MSMMDVQPTPTKGAGLTPHPWDAVADKIAPGAQTAERAAAIKEQTELDALVDEVLEHRREARYLLGRISDEDSEGDAARDRLVERVGEERARALITEHDWDSVGII